MKIDQVGQIVYNQDDLCDLLMQGSNLSTLNGVLVDTTVDLETAATILEDIPMFIKYNELAVTNVEEFDHRCQNTWHMPQKYKDLDIAEHVLSLCASDSELQRCGAELLLFQERDLFNLLRYLVYLVDTMQENNLIWGVGRGSSVASYVLYKLGVHRIDSLFYDLDPGEFLR
jgi:DNA polymerase III alpha subunit